MNTYIGIDLGTSSVKLLLVLGVFHQSFGRIEKNCDCKKYSKFNQLKGKFRKLRRKATNHGEVSPYIELNSF